MDFTGVTTVKTSYSLNEETNILTVTFKDESDVTIGTLVIENIKYKTLIKALGTIADERITSLMTQVGSRTAYRALDNQGETTFV